MATDSDVEQQCDKTGSNEDHRTPVEGGGINISLRWKG